MIRIKVKKTNEDAIIPTYSKKGDAGMDLYSIKDYYIPARRVRLIETGLKVEIPEGYEGQIRPRSGLALNHGITVLNTPGTIDSGYRGEIGVILINHGIDSYNIKKGDKIAQIIFIKHETANLEEVTELSETERGIGSFGHTGK